MFCWCSDHLQLRFTSGAPVSPSFIFATVTWMSLALWLSEHVVTWELCQDADILANGKQEIKSGCPNVCLQRPWLPLSPVIRHSAAQVSDSLSPFLYSQSPKICRFSNVTPTDMQHDLNVCNTRLFAIWNAISSTRTLKMVTPAPFDLFKCTERNSVAEFSPSLRPILAKEGLWKHDWRR